MVTCNDASGQIEKSLGQNQNKSPSPNLSSSIKEWYTHSWRSIYPRSQVVCVCLGGAVHNSPQTWSVTPGNRRAACFVADRDFHLDIEIKKNCSPPRAHLVTLLRAVEKGPWWNHVPPSWKQYHCRMAAQSTSNWKMHSMCWAHLRPSISLPSSGEGTKRLVTTKNLPTGNFRSLCEDSVDKLCGLRSGLVRVRL